MHDPKYVLPKFAYGPHHPELGKISWSKILGRVFDDMQKIYEKNKGTLAEGDTTVEVMGGLFALRGFALK